VPASAGRATDRQVSAVQINRRLILLVEDDPDSRACMRSLLELEGYAVQTAEDGAEALNRLRSGLEPGLIVLDLMMPGMDGFQFRREQLQDPKLSAIPVVVYSGHHDAKANAALLEPTAYIQKPIDFDSFLDLVSVHCMSLQPAV
jgi:CheY-like chemotaxis protein